MVLVQGLGKVKMLEVRSEGEGRMDESSSGEGVTEAMVIGDFMAWLVLGGENQRAALPGHTI